MESRQEESTALAAPRSEHRAHAAARLAISMAAMAIAGVAAALVALVAGGPEIVHHVIAITAGPSVLLPVLVLSTAITAASSLLVVRRVLPPAAPTTQPEASNDAGRGVTESKPFMDHLTGLGNHRAFQEEVERRLEESRKLGHSLALLMLDVDDFGEINESRGHASGDLLLEELSQLMRSVFRRSDHLFRVGGDEFAIVLPDAGVDAAAQAARRLLTAALTPRSSGQYRDEFSFSAGVSASPELAATRPALVEQASEAVDRAKREGRTLIKVFDPEHSSRGLGRAAVVRASASVSSLLTGRRLHAVYQPIVDLATGRVVGFEALARPDAAAGFESPAALFAAAEAAGRMSDLDQLCIETELAGARAIAEHQFLSLNVSTRTIERAEFSARSLAQRVAGAGWSPERLVIEVTEREPITDIKLARRRLDACRGLGIRVAIDDVGTSNAGLRLLSEIEFDFVKVDLSLVQAGVTEGSPRTVLHSLVDLARTAGAIAVAEGVETPPQFAAIRDLGFGQAQGYLLGRPSPTPELRTVPLEGLLRQPEGHSRVGAAAFWLSEPVPHHASAGG
jgi:diguanylate cyclase (GGDEF)-like protein